MREKGVGMVKQKEEWGALEQWYQSHQADIEGGYLEFLRFQSVSTDLQFQEELRACCDFLSKAIGEMGMEVEVWETAGHPTIFAQYDVSDTLPTLLIYNHYDVQPVDPLEEWEADPFEPQVRDGEVYARGAQDNKGQCFYVWQALKALLELKGTLPVNVKWCIEGEEEVGSPGLSKLLTSKKEQLSADYLVVADVGMHRLDQPAITLGVRGMVAMTLKLQGSKGDLHSGSHGGIAYNPNHALVEMLAALRDENGEVRVPGFYDGVSDLSDEELADYHFEMSEEEYTALFGMAPTGGEQAYPFQHRGSIRPTLELNGICGGYTGPGFKTVIPAQAMAKISCRLVPGQDPVDVASKVERYLMERVPPGIEAKVEHKEGGGKAVWSSPHSKVARAYAQAYAELFQKPCHQLLEGGSIPIVAELAEVSGAEVLLMGLGLPDDQIHAPNEHFGLERLRQGFLVTARALEILSS